MTASLKTTGINGIYTSGIKYSFNMSFLNDVTLNLSFYITLFSYICYIIASNYLINKWSISLFHLTVFSLKFNNLPKIAGFSNLKTIYGFEVATVYFYTSSVTFDVSSYNPRLNKSLNYLNYFECTVEISGFILSKSYKLPYLTIFSYIFNDTPFYMVESFNNVHFYYNLSGITGIFISVHSFDLLGNFWCLASISSVIPKNLLLKYHLAYEWLYSYFY